MLVFGVFSCFNISFFAPLNVKKAQNLKKLNLDLENRQPMIFVGVDFWPSQRSDKKVRLSERSVEQTFG
jgi:hypothetical protein